MAECGLGQEEDFLTDFEDSEDEDNCLPDFKEYMERELKYSRLEISDYPPGCENWYDKGIRWVFWNRQDDVTLSYDHSADSIPDVCASPDVRLNIRHALHKFILHLELQGCLVQFWAPTKTFEGRTLLTTQFQPFALGKTTDPSDTHQLCKYRMGICREYNSFCADAESGEEQLGLPGRVFLNKLPESTPYVENYTLKEYPQRDLAISCLIYASWALPVFELSSHTCVGVLELACVDTANSNWFCEEFLGRMSGIFQEFGLQCFDGYKHCKMQYGDKNEALKAAAFQELKMVYESVCKIHNLPLALTWVSCRSYNDLLQSQFQFVDDSCLCSLDLIPFMEVSKVCLLRKGHVTGRILPFPNLLYCSDVKKFSIAEFPLVPYARHCRLGGWFTMCLQSSYTGDELYVLEFFMAKSDENDENKLTKLRLILGTMEGYFKTFKLASGQGLGEALSVEVIDFQNGQKSHSIQMIPATRCIPGLELLKDGEVMLRLGQLKQPSIEAQKYSSPIFERVTTQLDSSNQLSLDPSSNGQNVITAERNILVVSSSREGKRKMQDREHKKAGVRIEVSLDEILKCSNMNRDSAARELKVSPSTFKRLCRGYDIRRWPPRNIENANPFRPLPVENQGQIPQLNSDLPSNQARVPRCKYGDH